MKRQTIPTVDPVILDAADAGGLLDELAVPALAVVGEQTTWDGRQTLRCARFPAGTSALMKRLKKYARPSRP